MEKTHQFKLVNGTFDTEHAGRVLFDLIGTKINFHNMERFSIRERFNGDTSQHDKRINELKEAMEYVRSVLKMAETEGKRLKLEGTIKIRLVK
jgi:hypothetical protein